MQGDWTEASPLSRPSTVSGGINENETLLGPRNTIKSQGSISSFTSSGILESDSYIGSAKADEESARQSKLKEQWKYETQYGERKVEGRTTRYYANDGAKEVLKYTHP